MKKINIKTIVVLYLTLFMYYICHSQGLNPSTLYSTSGVYTTRQFPGTTATRFFAIGTNINMWPNDGTTDTADRHNRVVSKNTLTSAKTIFNALFHTDTDLQLPTHYTGSSSLQGTDDCVFVGGDALEYHMLLSDIFNPKNNGLGDSTLGPTDQYSARSRLAGNTTAQGHFDTIYEELANTFETADTRHDQIILLCDEPDRGFKHWHFSGPFLSQARTRIRDSIYLNGQNPLIWVDLGPMESSKLIYKKRTGSQPSNDLADYSSIHADQYATYRTTANPLNIWDGVPDTSTSVNPQIFRDYQSNIWCAVDTFRNAGDVLGINSYWQTSDTYHDPNLPNKDFDPIYLGRAITTIHQNTTNAGSVKPVWVWITGESGDDGYYTHSCGYPVNPEKYRRAIRQQMYSAITHRVSGIFFFGDDATASGEQPKIENSQWDIVLDCAKELQLYRKILEEIQGGDRDWNYGTYYSNVHWRTVQTGSSPNYRYYMFAYNADPLNNKTVSVTYNEPGNINTTLNFTIPKNDGNNDNFGIWTKKRGDAATRKVDALENLGFESAFSTDQYTNWEIVDNIQDADVTRYNGLKKNGTYSLQVFDNNTNGKVYAEQSVYAIPGANYRFQIWAKGDGICHIAIKSLNNSETVIQEATADITMNNDWQLYTIETGPVSNSTNILKIWIGSTHSGTLDGWFDDAILRLIELPLSKPIAPNDQGIYISQEFQLSQNYPNPFNSETLIRYTVDVPQNVKVAIYDIRGRTVKVLVDDLVQTGDHQVKWDGRDENSQQVASGIYFSVLETQNRTLTRKLTLIK